MLNLVNYNHSPTFTSPDKSKKITIDHVNNSLIIQDIAIGKIITINSSEITNGAYSLSFNNMHSKIKAIEACLENTPTNTLSVNNTILITGQSGGTGTTITNDGIISSSNNLYLSSGNNYIGVTGNIYMDGTHTIQNIPTPVQSTDVAPKSYVDTYYPSKVGVEQVSGNTGYSMLMAVENNGSGLTVQSGTGITYNPSTSTLTATTFNGNATTATTATNIITTNDATNAQRNVCFKSGTGSSATYVSDGITFNPSTNTLTTSTFSGNVSGYSTGVNLSQTSSNTTYNIPFASLSSGNSPLLTDTSSGIQYNPFSKIFTIPALFSSKMSTPTALAPSPNISVDCGNASFATFSLSINLNGPKFSFINSKSGGQYFIYVINSTNTTYTISPGSAGVGNNIQTNFSSPITVPKLSGTSNGMALLTITPIQAGASFIYLMNGFTYTQ